MSPRRKPEDVERAEDRGRSAEAEAEVGAGAGEDAGKEPTGEEGTGEAAGREADPAPAEEKTGEAAGRETDPAPAEEKTGEAAGREDAAEKSGRRRRRAAETTPAGDPAAAERRRREPPDLDLTVRAQAKYVRCAPRKARLVVDHIRGKSVEDARAVLNHSPRAAAGDVLKLLNSCVANAENNHDLIADELRIDRAYVDEGPTIKRYRPRALGRATRIRKRTSHMTITLKPFDPADRRATARSRKE